MSELELLCSEQELLWSEQELLCLEQELLWSLNLLSLLSLLSLSNKGEIKYENKKKRYRNGKPQIQRKLEDQIQ